MSTVEGSLSSAGSGGGIYGTQCGVQLVNSRLAGNTADSNGGGAALQQCLAAFDKSVVENNQVTPEGCVLEAAGKHAVGNWKGCWGPIIHLLETPPAQHKVSDVAQQCVNLHNSCCSRYHSSPGIYGHLWRAVPTC